METNNREIHRNFIEHFGKYLSLALIRRWNQKMFTRIIRIDLLTIGRKYNVGLRDIHTDHFST